MSVVQILLVGAGGHSRACIDVIEQEGRFTVAGLVGLSHEVGTRVLGYRVFATDAELPQLLNEFAHALVTVGQIKSPELRIRLFEVMQQRGCTLPIIVSPRAYVSPHAVLGEGTIVMHGAVVNAGAVIGRNCIINSHCLIEHDAVIGDHCHVSTMAAVNSGVQVAEGTFLGSNSSVRQGIKIGERCVIGLGERVLSNCVDRTWLPVRGKKN